MYICLKYTANNIRFIFNFPFYFFGLKKFVPRNSESGQEDFWKIFPKHFETPHPKLR